MSVTSNDVNRVLSSTGMGGAGAMMLPNTGDGFMAKIVPITCIAVGVSIMVWMFANRVVRRVVVARSTKA